MVKGMPVFRIIQDWIYNFLIISQEKTVAIIHNIDLNVRVYMQCLQIDCLFLNFVCAIINIVIQYTKGVDLIERN